MVDASNNNINFLSNISPQTSGTLSLPTPRVSGTLSGVAGMANTAVQWHTPIDCCGARVQQELIAAAWKVSAHGKKSKTLGGQWHAKVGLLWPAASQATWHALVGCYGRHRRSLARSSWLLWPASPGHVARFNWLCCYGRRRGSVARFSNCRINCYHETTRGVMANTAGQWDAPHHTASGTASISCYGQHRRPVGTL